MRRNVALQYRSLPSIRIPTGRQRVAKPDAQIGEALRGEAQESRQTGPALPPPLNHRFWRISPRQDFLDPPRPRPATRWAADLMGLDLATRRASSRLARDARPVSSRPFRVAPSRRSAGPRRSTRIKVALRPIRQRKGGQPDKHQPFRAMVFRQ